MKVTAPYFPFWQRDFVHSVRKAEMTPDEVGALVMVMCQQWEDAGPISFDPKWFAAYTGWDIRVAKRLLERLATIKKIDKLATGYSSARMAEEITKYVAKVKASEEREARKKAAAVDQQNRANLPIVADAIRQTSPELVPNLLEMFQTSLTELSEKMNKNNTNQTTEAALPDSDSDSERKSTPLPPKGGSLSKTRNRGRLSAEQIAQTDVAHQAWNSIAQQHGLVIAKSFPSARRTRLAKRLDDIGGLDNFRLALSAIPQVPFLMGKVAPKLGQEPFKMEFDHLLQTEGKLGDVLAKLIDKAASMPEQRSAPWWQDAAAVAMVTDDQWRELIAKYAVQIWDVRELGPPPGSHRCVVPRHLIAEMKLDEIWDHNGLPRKRVHA